MRTTEPASPTESQHHRVVFQAGVVTLQDTAGVEQLARARQEIIVVAHEEEEWAAAAADRHQTERFPFFGERVGASRRRVEIECLGTGSVLRPR
jgi:hypothetical protein